MSNVFTIFGTLFKITHPHMCIFYKRNFHVFFSKTVLYSILGNAFLPTNQIIKTNKYKTQIT